MRGLRRGGRRRRRLPSAGALAALLVVLCAPIADAAPGQLDRSFGRGGIGGEALEPHYANTSFTKVSEEAEGSLLTTRDRLEYRYLSDGRLDPGFVPREPAPDPNLESEIEVPGIYWIQDQKSLPSGKSLVLGQAGFDAGTKNIQSQLAVARLNPDGSLDRTYGRSGIVRLRSDYGLVGEWAWGLVVQPDEGVVVVSTQFAVRLGPGGALDSGYGEAGKAPLGDAHITDFDTGSEGTVTVAGSTYSPSCWSECAGNDFFVARLTPNGRFDATYAGGSGMARIDGGEDHAETVLFEADGSVAIGGTTRSSQSCEWRLLCPIIPAVVRFDAGGNPDTAFGGTGVVRLEHLAIRGYGVGVLDITARNGGGMVAAGGGGEGGSVAFLAAILPSGSLDPGFGNGGIVEERSPSPSQQRGVPLLAVAPDGKVLAAVGTNAGGHEGLGVVRFARDGKVDLSYGGGRGFVPVADHGVAGFTLDGAGRALLLTREGSVLRLTAAGKIDTSFGDRGPVALEQKGNPDYRAIAVQDDGKILIAGTSKNWTEPSRLRMVRLLPSGRPDPGFGEDGYAGIGCRKRGRCVPAGILLREDGRIVVAGTVLGSPREIEHDRGEVPSRIALFQLRPGGRPDRSFSRDGIVTLRETKHSEAKAATLRGGNVFVAGWALKQRGSRGLLAKFESDGSLDRSFGEGGVSRAFPPGSGKANGILSTGRRLIVGMRPEGRVLVAGFHLDGRPDSSYRRPLRRTVAPELGEGPSLALQGRRVLLGWIQKGSKGKRPPELRLTRLFAR